MVVKEIYREKLTTAEEAVKLIKSGNTVILGHAAAEPPVLVAAMVANKESYKNVTISHMVSMGKGEYALPENKEHFNVRCWFAGAGTRRAINEGDADFVPVFLHQVPFNLRKGIINIDVLMVMVSPPDENGYCSAGVSSDYTMEAAKQAKIVLAEVNDQMPYVYGDTLIHVSEIDKLIETSHPLAEIKAPVIDEVEATIGKYCASLVEDGSTLQLGIGAIPDAVLAQLKDKKHLGIHSEMISSGIVDLYKAGAIDGSEKGIDKGKLVGTFIMGDKSLYDFVNHNPVVLLKPADYVNHPMIIAQNTKMISINACMQVDFLGQVVSDTIGTKQFSGVGGQVDFVRGAAMSLDGLGKAIIAMPSTATLKDGSIISKIVPYIDHGAAVTTSRHDVDYIVTEYGIAELKGKSLKERASTLINIAHPNFRNELATQYKKRFNVKF
ncbi:4-hydroxybutyrate CoA-transferase [Clostridium sp. FP2]|uniref:acetyl-CoA hydrolase/transferase family protein n=1 Tax=Clostridium sp. FP2 TaxID=2724481 RepID=UPI0013E99D2D|nr:acetyl-CoA hydrolase/transferase family protein [Clostridium sp. FP2]MBZ9626012.1 4-hydroxybutyrate CoA-transferase [Clostridium sp. FP2]